MASTRLQIKGKRDRALLALLLACGLRRHELAVLTVGHLIYTDSPARNSRAQNVASGKLDFGRAIRKLGYHKQVRSRLPRITPDKRFDLIEAALAVKDPANSPPHAPGQPR